MEIPDYDLPDSAIGQTPREPRDSARLLDALSPEQTIHRIVRDLPDLLSPGDVVVVNSSRVIPARIIASKHTGGKAEVLLLEADPGDPTTWTALVRPGRRLPPGTLLYAPGRSDAILEVGPRRAEGQRAVTFKAEPEEVMARWGSVALPPYINRPLGDPDRYQTVYADQPGSVAAPTAGLHLTPEIIDRLGERAIKVVPVDLAVGLATFRPVTAARAEDHVMHSEHYRIPRETWAACQSAVRVVAIGTTAVRALETASVTGELEGDSTLFITDSSQLSVTDVLMTNFHMPRSTLLLLLQAFCGERWRQIYAGALSEGYRFLSFGDAMIVAR